MIKQQIQQRVWARLVDLIYAGIENEEYFDTNTLEVDLADCDGALYDKWCSEFNDTEQYEQIRHVLESTGCGF